jgi:hypothetical protein
MNAELLRSKFARMGVRLRIGPSDRPDSTLRRDLPLTLDVQRDGHGEFFDIGLRAGTGVALDVVDLRKRDRHLLLRARDTEGSHLFLCGQDERHWFVAAIPEREPGVASVADAMEALKPPEVLDAQARQGVKGKALKSRKNAAYRRQGEWFFLPAPHLKVESKLVLRNEPLSRGNGSKPHWAEFCYRIGGETVHVCAKHPAGLRHGEYVRLLASHPNAKTWGWRVMRRNPEAYVKGRIRHEDHETINLFVWHRVVMNTEGQARAMRHVVFLD